MIKQLRYLKNTVGAPALSQVRQRRYPFCIVLCYPFCIVIYRKSGKDNYFGKDTDGNGQFGAWDYSGYKLLGWSTNRNATSATYGINHFITDREFESWWPDITLYAVWQPDYIYIKRGGVWKPGEVYIKVNGAWKQGRPYIKKSSTWMQ